MGVSTKGLICFGISFPNDYEFPWDDEKYDGIDGWWMDVRGYKEPFPLWIKSGMNEIYRDRKSEYYSHGREWEKVNPLPVEEIRHCSCEYPMIIIAATGTLLEATRGNPEDFCPSDLRVDDGKYDTVIEFCKKYCNPESDEFPKMELKWWLTSNWSW